MEQENFPNDTMTGHIERITWLLDQKIREGSRGTAEDFIEVLQRIKGIVALYETAVKEHAADRLIVQYRLSASEELLTYYHKKEAQQTRIKQHMIKRHELEVETLTKRNKELESILERISK